MNILSKGNTIEEIILSMIHKFKVGLGALFSNKKHVLDRTVNI